MEMGMGMEVGPGLKLSETEIHHPPILLYPTLLYATLHHSSQIQRSIISAEQPIYSPDRACRLHYRCAALRCVRPSTQVSRHPGI
jgi:hypothetical protein